ncbi:MAG: TetR family transcriptional regulator [Gammaproteobacteria bacterium]|nr:TetR family transcriptional regulator [Gammaproteobacteria bacterium]
MARKTKAEAQLTRQQIIDAARQTFVKRGVSRTTMEHIAETAGVTRGAVYWHFASKTDVFFAMRDQVALPLLDRISHTLLDEERGDPLSRIETYMQETMELLATDAVARQTYEIITSKCEYVYEFAGVRAQMMQCGHDMLAKLTAAYSRAKDKGLLRQGLEPAAMALDTFAFSFSLIHLWFADSEKKLIRTKCHDMIKAHISLRRL